MTCGLELNDRVGRPLVTAANREDAEQVNDPDVRTSQHGGLSITELTPQRYADKVGEHAKTSASNSLYPGSDYGTLARFLWMPYLAASSQSNHVETSELLSTNSQKFVVVYNLHALKAGSKPIALHPSLSLRELPTRDEFVKSERGILIFLRGYPSAAWLNAIGAKYHIDPEFFYRHLSFFHNPQATERQTPFILPSSQGSIFQLTLTSIGRHSNVSDEKLATQRERTTKQMEPYLQDLKIVGSSSWKVGSSIVRSFALHNREIFSIEQLVTVYVAELERGTGAWIALVWLDSGNDLYQSPVGPWFDPSGSQMHTHLYPVTLYTRGVALKRHRLHDETCNPIHGPRGLTQNISLLPQYYGRSLNPATLCLDPFYALNELFAFCATSEIQFLNVIESGLKFQTVSPLNALPQQLAEVQADLVYYKEILEDHIHKIAETLTFIKGRHSLDWPRSNSNKAERAAARLESDFEYLLSQAKLLQKRCGNAILNLMNHATLEEAKRGVAEGRRMFKLTVLASLFLPLSFCASIFSMSFVTFESKYEGILSYLVVTLVLFTSSMIMFGWDSEQIKRKIEKLRVWFKKEPKFTANA